MKKHFFLALFCLYSLAVCATTPEQTTTEASSATESRSVEDATDDRKIIYKAKEPNLRFNILGGPSYTPDFGFLIGASALFTFSTDPSNPDLKRSVMPLALALTFSQPMGLNAILKPQLFFNDDKIRLFGTFVYKSSNDNYSGIGFETAHNVTRGRSITGYTSNAIRLNPELKFRMGSSDIFLGPTLDYFNETITDPGSYIVSDPLYIEQGGDATGLSFQNLGAGFNVSYDTRDVPANAYEGVFVEFKTTYYPKLFGEEFNYGTISFDYRQYIKLSPTKRRVLTWTIATESVIGNAPFTRYSFIGSPFDLRGYYAGQYRDKYTLSSVVEYRQMIDLDEDTRVKKFLNHFGFAAWAGLGLIGSEPSQLQKALPNFGAGIRIELQPRMNFRFDVGYSPIDKQTLFYFNMTEAF